MLPYIYSKNTDYLYFDDKNNRYILGKVGKASGAPLICFGINPSTATPENGDNTITAITNMSNHFGYNGWVMLNIYPQRSTKQHNLDKTCDVKIHQKNLEVIRSVFEALLTRYGQLDVLCAWGGGIMNRSYLPKCLQDISAISKDKINYKCLCTLKNGHPHHPLYVAYKKMKGLNSFDLNKYLESLPSMQSNMLLSADEIGSRVTNAQFVEFQEKIGVLKHLRRTGWVVRNVPKAETVAAHSWRMALMAMQKENELKNLGVNSAKVIEMCLLHDVAEAVVGDIMPEEWQTGSVKISREEKSAREKASIQNLADKYNFPKLKLIFDEYEEQKTPEAKVVKNLDKLDLILQAYEYKTQYPDLVRLNEFMEYNEKDINLPMFKAEVAEIKARQFGRVPHFNKFIDLQILAGKLKYLERGGPKMYNIKDCETVAAHCFRTAVMALQLETELTAQNLDVSTIVKTAIVHDLGEAVIGDIVPEKWQKGTKISNAEKHKKEVAAIMSMAKQYDMPFIWEAFDATERRTTPEAAMTKDLEIFESIQQAYEYIKIYPEKAILREYIPYHQPRIKSDLVQSLIGEVKVRQDNLLKAKHFPTFYQEGGR